MREQKASHAQALQGPLQLVLLLLLVRMGTVVERMHTPH
jgi:hypothetical protein